MKRVFFMALSGVICLVFYIGHCNAAEKKLPVINGKEVVAMVNNEPITAEEFGVALGDIQHGKVEEGSKASVIDYKGILDRLIDQQLFLQEARTIGIDRLPDVTASINDNAQKTLAKMLVRGQWDKVEVDKDEVERRYKEETREYKITALVFEKEEDAKAMEDEISSGAPFDDVVKKVIADGKILESTEGEYVKERDLLPEVSGVISKMEVGTVSPLIKFDKGYVKARLEDVRYPDDPEIRARITASLASIQRVKTLDEYTKSLIKKYVTIDEKLLDRIDYDTSEEEFNKFMEDGRVIARVKKGENVTVKELSAAFQDKFYHGVGDLIKRKGLNIKKQEVLEGILQKRVLVIEAKSQGIDKTDTYKDSIEKYNRTIVFEQFLNKVITPGIRITEDQVRAYYNEHPDSFITPEMMRIDSLAFDRKENAEAAIRTLSTGTEFKWLRANAEGQVESNEKESLDFGGNVLSIKLLPAEVQEVLSGVNAGDFRLLTSSDGYYYVLYAQQVFPSSLRPYEEVKDEIVKDLYNSKVAEAIKEWSDKLKEHYPVEVYLEGY